MDDKAAAGSIEAPIPSVCDNYTEELDQQLLLMLDEDHEILENSREDFPAPRSAVELGTFPLG